MLSSIVIVAVFLYQCHIVVDTEGFDFSDLLLSVLL